MRRILLLFIAAGLAVLLPAGCRKRSNMEPPEAAAAAPQPEIQAAVLSPPAAQTRTVPDSLEPAAGTVEDAAKAEPAVPDIMEELLESAGYTLTDIYGRQLLIVKSTGNTADIFAFAAGEDGTWRQEGNPISGHTGKNGVTGKKTEGDRSTPKGLYSLTQVFGIQEDPGCLLPYRRVSTDSYWVDDPDSAYYNQWVEGTENKDWSSAEHLMDYPKQYAYAVVIDYNTDPVEPGAGSAIFLHCGSNATAGCVSMAQPDILRLLMWLDPSRSPAVLIF